MAVFSSFNLLKLRQKNRGCQTALAHKAMCGWAQPGWNCNLGYFLSFNMTVFHLPGILAWRKTLLCLSHCAGESSPSGTYAPVCVDATRASVSPVHSDTPHEPGALQRGLSFLPKCVLSCSGIFCPKRVRPRGTLCKGEMRFQYASDAHTQVEPFSSRDLVSDATDHPSTSP